MNLTEIGYYARKAVIGIGVGVVILIIVRALLLYAIKIYRESHQPPPAPPTVLFGRLPKLDLPDEGKHYSLKFQLVTKEVGLPSTPDRLEVFFMPKKQPSLLAQDKAKTFAARLNFTDPPQELSASEYLFTSSKLPARSLSYNSETGNFHLHYDLTRDPSVASPSSLLTSGSAMLASEDFLKKYSPAFENFDDNKTTTHPLIIDGQNLIETKNPSIPSAIRVDFFLKDMSTYPLKTVGFFSSPNYTIVDAQPNEDRKFIDVEAAYFPIDENVKSTYPLKTSDQAWNELLNGQGFVAHFPEVKDKDVIVRKVYLAYYQSNSYQNYLQPVFVFEGDDNFIGYVPAITSEFTESAEMPSDLPLPTQSSDQPK